MPVVSRSIEIEAPPEQVWARVTDLEGAVDWNVTHVAYPDGVPAELGPSAEFKEKVKIMGMPGEVTWAVAEIEAPCMLQLEGKGPMGTKARAGYVLEAVDGGTRLTAESEFGGPAVVPLAAALEKESDKALGESLEKLRALVA